MSALDILLSCEQHISRVWGRGKIASACKSLVVTTIKEYFAIHYLSIPRVIIALNIL